MNDKYESIKLKNQLCFPLYAVSNIITRKYRVFLEQLDLTYTQYIVMLVLWEQQSVNEMFLCKTLCLKSNTLTPLLKKLEDKGYIIRNKDINDERNLIISLTKEGDDLKDRALCVPESISKEFHLEENELTFLYQILYKIINEEKNKY